MTRVVRLRDDTGLEAEVLPFGATLRALRVPDRTGALVDVVLGFDDPADYQRPHPYLGCTVGRFANRIANGSFTLEGREYVLPANDGPHHLHGGPEGFHRREWTIADAGPAHVRLTLVSADGDQGYPGTLNASVTYTLAPAALQIVHEATTDRPTIVNLAHHSYWNLYDGGATDIGRHVVTIAADHYLPIDDAGIPIGALAAVDGTGFDFRHGRVLGDALATLDANRGGYDHCFVVRGAPGTMRFVARVAEPTTARTMEVWSDAPGVQLYTGNFLDGSMHGKRGVAYGRHAGLCVETQAFPNAPNAPGFPSTTLHPGDGYRHMVAFRFGR